LLWVDGNGRTWVLLINRLELVGHVTAENPPSHLLLGKLAIHLHDKRLLRDAKDILAVLQQSWAIAELENAQRTRVFEF